MRLKQYQPEQRNK